MSIYALAADGEDIYIGTGGQVGHGIWRRPVSEMVRSVGVVETGSLSHFSLSQNYPNPFNPTTTISFSIAKRGLVTLKIYNVLGREIKTLVNQEKLPGNYQVKFNGGDLASGVYFYQVKTGDKVTAKKMILLK